MEAIHKHRFLLVVASCCLIAIAALVWQMWQKSQPVLEPALSVGEASDTTPKVNANEQLEKKVADWVAAQTSPTSVVVQQLDGERLYTDYQPKKQMIPGSTYKLFLAYAVLKKVEANKATLTQKIETGETIEQCLQMLLVESSNDCAYSLGKVVGWQVIDQQLAAAGFRGTKLNNYDQNGDTIGNKLSTAEDLAAYFSKLQSGALLNAKHSALVTDLLEKQVWRERIAGGVPETVQVISKPGWINGVEADAGIVYAPSGTYILVVLAADSTPQALAELSKRVYNQIELQ